MIKPFLICLIAVLPTLAIADVVVPTRTIRANAIIMPDEVGLRPINSAEGFQRVEDVIGQEARVTLYAGRPIPFDGVGPPALVTRNQIVSIQFVAAGLVISTEGRSLERGGVGDNIRIMNLDSRTTLFGQIQENGSVRVFR